MAKVSLDYCVEAELTLRSCPGNLEVYLCERSITTVSPTVIRFIKIADSDKKMYVIPMHLVDCIVVTDNNLRIIK